MKALEFVQAQIYADRIKAEEFRVESEGWESLTPTRDFVVRTLLARANAAEAMLDETAALLENLDWDVAFGSVEDALEAYIAPVLARSWPDEPGFRDEWKLSASERFAVAHAAEPDPPKQDPIEALSLDARVALTSIEANELRQRGAL